MRHNGNIPATSEFHWIGWRENIDWKHQIGTVGVSCMFPLNQLNVNGGFLKAGYAIQKFFLWFDGEHDNSPEDFWVPYFETKQIIRRWVYQQPKLQILVM